MKPAALLLGIGGALIVGALMSREPAKKPQPAPEPGPPIVPPAPPTITIPEITIQPPVGGPLPSGGSPPPSGGESSGWPWPFSDEAHLVAIGSMPPEIQGGLGEVAANSGGLPPELVTMLGSIGEQLEAGLPVPPELAGVAVAVPPNLIPAAWLEQLPDGAWLQLPAGSPIPPGVVDLSRPEWWGLA